MNKTVLETVVERSQNLETSLKTLAYAMEAMKNIDNGEEELREIGWDVENQIDILQGYQTKTLQIMEQLKVGQDEDPDRADEIKEKILPIDIKELEKSVHDTYNVCALMGSLVRTIHDYAGDSIATEEGRFCWQLQGSIQMAYAILDQATSTLFEVLDIANRLQREDD